MKFIVQVMAALAVISPASAAAQDYAASALNAPAVPGHGTYGAKTSIIDDAGVPGGKALRVEAEKGANDWDASVLSGVKAPVKAGDDLVLAFWARLVAGANGATSSTLPWNSVSLATAPWTAVFGGPATIGPQWKLYEIRGRADRDYAAGALQAGIQVANARQTIDFGPIYVARAAGAAPAAAAAPPPPRKTPASALSALDPARIAGMIINDPGAPQVNKAKASIIDDARVTGGKALRVQVAAKGKNPWDSNVSSALKKPIKAGDNLLLVFWARLEQGENGATSTTLPWNALSLTSPPWTGIAAGPADIGPEWKQFEFTGKADKDYSPSDLNISIQLATARQTVDFGPILLLDTGR